jgi:hypothetical protein
LNTRRTDLAVAGGTTGSVFLDTGGGSFTTTTATPADNPLGHILTGVAAGDFNGDGKAELAFTRVGPANNQQTSSTLGAIDVVDPAPHVALRAALGGLAGRLVFETPVLQRDGAGHLQRKAAGPDLLFPVGTFHVVTP